MPPEVKIIHYARHLIRQWSTLSYWIILCPKFPPFALTHACRQIHHCLTAVSIMHLSSHSDVMLMQTLYRVKAVHIVKILTAHYTALSPTMAWKFSCI